MARKKQREDLLETRARAYVVDGPRIGPRWSEPLGIAGGGLTLFVISLVCMGGFTESKDLNPVTARLLAYAIVGGVVCLIGVGCVVYLLVRFRRLVIGADRVQLVGGFGRIIGQVPYSNVVEMKLNSVEGQFCVTMLLESRRRKDTWWPRFHWRDDIDVMIPAGFETDATAVHMQLRDAMREYWQEHGEPHWRR